MVPNGLNMYKYFLIEHTKQSNLVPNKSLLTRKTHQISNGLKKKTKFSLIIFLDLVQDHLPLGKLKNSFKKIKFSDPTFRAVKIFLLNDA